MVRLGGGSLAFTGSATEAINWALKGTIERVKGRTRIVTIATEHAAHQFHAQFHRCVLIQGNCTTLLERLSYRE